MYLEQNSLFTVNDFVLISICIVNKGSKIRVIYKAGVKKTF